MKFKIILALIVLLVIIQFFKNNNNVAVGIAKTDIRNRYEVPQHIISILEKACYDCHSNNTIYPWYANVQPLGWYLQNHVNEGKSELNFSEFSLYAPKKAHHKLEEIEETITAKEMPLPSYLNLHSNAKLSNVESEQLIEWTKKIRSAIKK